MPLRKWFATPRRVLIVFFAITLLPAAALGYLTWRLVEQERSAGKQWLRERLEQAADHIAAASQARLAELEKRLPATPAAARASSLPEYTIALIAERNSIETIPPRSLVYYPVLPVAAEAPPGTFAEGERLEFQQNN